jgi:hypothetical protein
MVFGFELFLPPWGDVHPLSPLPHILPDPQKGAPPTELPQREMLPKWGRCFLSGALELSLKIPSHWTPQFPQWAPTETGTRLQNFYTFPSKSPVNEPPPPLHVPQQGPYGERSFLSRANGLIIHLYLSGSPIRSPPTKKMGKHLVTVHGAPCGRKAYIQWGAAWFPKGTQAILTDLFVY